MDFDDPSSLHFDLDLDVLTDDWDEAEEEIADLRRRVMADAEL